MSATMYPWRQAVVSFLRDHPKIVLAFLFGSAARNRTRANSDIDFAIHLREPYSDRDVAAVWDGLEAATHRDVDLIVLNTAPPGIAWTSMKGQVLVDKDPGVHLELMLQKSREAEDFRDFVTAFLTERRRRWRNRGGPPVA